MRFVDRLIIKVIAISLLSSGVVASSLPDYYSEPGISGNRAYETGMPAESVDALSGGLLLHHTDLVVPGNAGMDIVVQRNYRAPAGQPGILGSDYLQGKTVLGEGWDIHFGRVWHGNLFSAPGRGCGTNQANTGSNPVLELPDGSRKELLDAPTSESYGYITKDLWIGGRFS